MNMNDKFIDVLKASFIAALREETPETIHAFIDCFVMAKQMGVIE